MISWYLLWDALVLIVVIGLMGSVYDMEVKAIRKRISGANGFVFMVAMGASALISVVGGLISIGLSHPLNGLAVIGIGLFSIVAYYRALMKVSESSR